MNVRVVKWVLLFLAGIFFQSIIIDNLITIKGIRPDIVLLVLIFFGLEFGEVYPIIVGFSVGLIQGFGFMGDGFIGLAALTKSFSGFYISFFHKSKKKWNDGYFLLILITTCLIHNMLFYYVNMFGSENTIYYVILRSVIPTAIYTATVGMIIFYSIKK